MSAPRSLRQQLARRLALGCAVGVAIALSSRAVPLANPLAAPEPGLIEAGMPPFSVLGPESMGLTSAPLDLKRLPDGRILAWSPTEFAIGDGIRWEVFHRADLQDLPATRQVMVDEHGDIYLGIQGGFARVDFLPGNRWKPTLVASLPSNAPPDTPACVSAIAAAGQWFWWSDSGTVISWRPGATARMEGRSNYVQTIVEIEGTAYLSDSSNFTLQRWTDAGFASSAPLIAQPANTVLTNAATSPLNETWVGTEFAGLFHKTDQGNLRPHAHALLDGSHRINAVSGVAEGHLAVAVDTVGLVFLDLDGDVQLVLDRTLDHRLARPLAILPSPGGVVWVLLHDGLARIRYPSRISFFDPFITTATAFSQPLRLQGRLWLLADNRAHRGVYDTNGRFLNFRIDSPDGNVVTLQEMDGMICATTETGLYRRLETGRWQKLTPEPHVAFINPTEIEPGRRAYLAMGEYGWLVRDGEGYRIERLERADLTRGFGSLTDQHGVMWTELGSGKIARTEPMLPWPRVTLYDVSKGVPDAWAQLSLLHGEIRVNGAGRFCRFDPGQDQFVLDTASINRHPELKVGIGRPTADAMGRFWIPTQNRIHIFDANSDARSPDGAVIPESFYPNYLTPQADGVMWLSQRLRLARYDPAIPHVPSPPLKAFIARIDFPLSNRAVYGPTSLATPIPAADNAITLHLQAPDSPFDLPVTFEVQLNQKSAEWIPVGVSGQVSFSHLSRGDYTLRVRSVLGETRGEETTIPLSVLAPWHLTTWALTSYGLLLVLGVFGAIRFSNYVEYRKNAQLESEVAARTAELNRANQQLERQFEETVAENERRRELESRLHQSQKIESIGTLAGGIAHDFNNILTGILGYCQLAALEVTTEPVADYLRELRKNALRAKDLTSRILTFSRQHESERKPIDLAETVGEAVKLVRATTPTSIYVRVDLESCWVMADATEIHQVVVNLCTNGLHAIGESGGVIRVSLRRVDRMPPLASGEPRFHSGPAVRLEVEDSGCGMDEATLARMFDPFFTTKEKGKGTGLGLSTVQGIVSNHEGTIEVRSQAGVGSTFSIHFPETPETGVPGAELETIPPGMRREVLIVDDEPSVSHSLARLLQRHGYRVFEAGSPDIAIRIFGASPARFAAIITDITMPQINGITLAQRLRLQRPDLPVVFMSGFGHRHAGELKAQFPDAELIAKPFEESEIAHALARLLNIKR